MDNVTTIKNTTNMHKKRKQKSKKKVDTKFDDKPKRCPHSNLHNSNDYKNTINILVVEEDANYINEGYYLHGAKCRKCKRSFVRTLSGSRSEVTINRRKKAFRCENQPSVGCKIVWCHDCYNDEVTKY